MCDSSGLFAPEPSRSSGGKESWAERGSGNIYNFLGIHRRDTHTHTLTYMRMQAHTLTHHIGLISACRNVLTCRKQQPRATES